MSLFVDKAATVPVHHHSWPEAQTVEVYRDMSFAAKREIDAAMLSIRASKDGEIDAKAEISAMKKETLRQMIASWTLTNGSGEPVPPTPEAIDQLRAPVADYIYREISRLNPELTEDERADFSAEPAPGSTAEGALPRRR